LTVRCPYSGGIERVADLELAPGMLVLFVVKASPVAAVTLEQPAADSQTFNASQRG
jgi:hypothetical protein